MLRGQLLSCCLSVEDVVSGSDVAHGVDYCNTLTLQSGLVELQQVGSVTLAANLMTCASECA